MNYNLHVGEDQGWPNYLIIFTTDRSCNKDQKDILTNEQHFKENLKVIKSNQMELKSRCD